MPNMKIRTNSVYRAREWVRRLGITFGASEDRRNIFLSKHIGYSRWPTSLGSRVQSPRHYVYFPAVNERLSGRNRATVIPLPADHDDVQQRSAGSMRREQPPAHGKPYWMGALSGVVANESCILLANVRHQCTTMVLVIFDRCCHIVDGLHHLI